MSRFTLASLPCLAVLVAPVSAQISTRVVLVSHRVANLGSAPMESVTAHCILPASNLYQEVLNWQIDPAPAHTQTDSEGQEVVVVPLGTIPPGQCRSVRLAAWARLKPANVPLVRKPAGIEPLDDLVRAALVADDLPLRLPKVKPLAEKIAASKTRDVDRARLFYEWMAGHCHYDIDLKDDPADAVLAGVPGSCTELAFAFIALCRSVDIPARLTTAYVNRQDEQPSTDWRTHAWAEFYAEGIGWVPVDPTNRLNYPRQDYFARQEPKYLTVRDDGVPLDEPPDPAWRIVFVTTTTPLPTMAISRTAVWHASVGRTDETAFFVSACEALRKTEEEERLAAVQEWFRGRQPLRVAFLLEATFDPSARIRKMALDALGQTRDGTLMIPLMDMLKSEKDESVKAAILAAARQLLDDAEGEQRALVVAELAKSRNEEALKLLKGIWNDSSRAVRVMAAQMLYKFGDKPAVHEEYRRLLTDEDDYVRVLAALRWSRIGTRESLEALIDFLESNVDWDRRRVFETLRRLSGDGFGYVPAARPSSNRAAIRRFKDWVAKQPAIRPPTSAPEESDTPERRE
ncbi:MAG: hypothetical protein KA354_11260 [Phycisphaerae bacterium]|nr:hypothetical protein [Phycisphaerae bacterium]